LKGTETQESHGSPTSAMRGVDNGLDVGAKP
jgi:hypothetical protein